MVHDYDNTQTCAYNLTHNTHTRTTSHIHTHTHTHPLTIHTEIYSYLQTRTPTFE